jgi:protein-S-isoprenylcysteine O-methyltransferase Ste14
MDYLGGGLTVGLFAGYRLLWMVKNRALKMRIGTDADVLKQATNPIQRYFGSMGKVMQLIVVALIVSHFFIMGSFPFFERLSIVNSPVWKLIGFAVGILGLTLCRIAQITIGDSWRMGIDVKAKPGLVTTGLYSSIRNPTYTGLFILCAGVLLVNPTVLFSNWVVAFILMMEFQVRCEEEYLENVYGEEYHAYCRKTKRYIPFVY